MKEQHYLPGNVLREKIKKINRKQLGVMVHIHSVLSEKKDFDAILQVWFIKRIK